MDEDGFFDTDKEKVDYLFFGLVIGFEIELGYFALSDLISVGSDVRLPIERDLYYQPKTLAELQCHHRESAEKSSNPITDSRETRSREFYFVLDLRFCLF